MLRFLRYRPVLLDILLCLALIVWALWFGWDVRDLIWAAWLAGITIPVVYIPLLIYHLYRWQPSRAWRDVVCIPVSCFIAYWFFAHLAGALTSLKPELSPLAMPLKTLGFTGLFQGMLVRYWPAMVCSVVPSSYNMIRRDCERTKPNDDLLPKELAVRAVAFTGILALALMLMVYHLTDRLMEQIIVVVLLFAGYFPWQAVWKPLLEAAVLTIREENGATVYDFSISRNRNAFGYLFGGCAAVWMGMWLTGLFLNSYEDIAFSVAVLPAFVGLLLVAYAVCSTLHLPKMLVVTADTLQLVSGFSFYEQTKSVRLRDVESVEFVPNEFRVGLQDGHMLKFDLEGFTKDQTAEFISAIRRSAGIEED